MRPRQAVCRGLFFCKFCGKIKAMDFTTILLIIIVVGLAAAIFLLLQKNRGQDKTDSNSLLLLQQQINQIASAVDSKLSESNKNVQEQFSESVKIVRDVTEKLVELDKTNKQVISFADQLKYLQDILKNPKQRGVLGEFFLETILKNVLPPGNYKMQYPLGIDDKTGKDLIVDAAIFVRDKVIPVDSKFSLENYNRLVQEKNPVEKERLEKVFKADLKARIDETAKYIKPSQGTMEFAFMFIPHEAIYYDLLVNEVGAIKVNTQDLIEYAFRTKRVILVSPTTFFAFLQTVLQGLNSLQIEESTKEIIKGLELLKRHIVSHEDYMKKLGSYISGAVSSYNHAAGEFKKIDKDVARLTSGESKVELREAERPVLDE